MTTTELKVTDLNASPKDVLGKNENRPSQHIGKSVDQVKFADEAKAQEKLGDNKAEAIPVSGSVQHKPHLKDCDIKK